MLGGIGFLLNGKPGYTWLSPTRNPIPSPFDGIQFEVTEATGKEDHPLDPPLLEPDQAQLALVPHQVERHRLLPPVIPQVTAENFPAPGPPAPAVRGCLPALGAARNPRSRSSPSPEAPGTGRAADQAGAHRGRPRGHNQRPFTVSWVRSSRSFSGGKTAGSPHWAGCSEPKKSSIIRPVMLGWRAARSRTCAALSRRSGRWPRRLTRPHASAPGMAGHIGRRGVGSAQVADHDQVGDAQIEGRLSGRDPRPLRQAPGVVVRPGVVSPQPQLILDGRFLSRIQRTCLVARHSILPFRTSPRAAFPAGSCGVHGKDVWPGIELSSDSRMASTSTVMRTSLPTIRPAFSRGLFQLRLHSFCGPSILSASEDTRSALIRVLRLQHPGWDRDLHLVPKTLLIRSKLLLPPLQSVTLAGNVFDVLHLAEADPDHVAELLALALVAGRQGLLG